MEELRTFLWVVNFLFFSLILIFLWSKVVIVNKRLKAVQRLLAIGEEIDREHKRLGERKKRKA
ncbi:hypothetical protein R80B4_00112 [Fibrobacteres bacterium R8-0-B4]